MADRIASLRALLVPNTSALAIPTRNPAMIHRPRRSRPCDSGLSLATPSGWESDADTRCLLVHLGAAFLEHDGTNSAIHNQRASSEVPLLCRRAGGARHRSLRASRVHADKPSGRRLRWPRSAECTTMVRTWRPHDLARP